MGRNFVLDITILFENAVHILGRYGHSLRAWWSGHYTHRSGRRCRSYANGGLR